MDQTQITRYVSRFKPLLYVSAFTQKDFHYVHTGSSTKGPPLRYTWNTLLLSQTQSPVHKRDRHKAKTQIQSPLHNRDRHKAKAQTQSPLHKRDRHKAKIQSPLHKRDKAQS